MYGVHRTALPTETQTNDLEASLPHRLENQDGYRSLSEVNDQEETQCTRSQELSHIWKLPMTQPVVIIHNMYLCEVIILIVCQTVFCNQTIEMQISLIYIKYLHL